MRHDPKIDDIIPYLNKALEFLEEREKTEAALLRLHMDLYENWQVDVSRWRLEHHYHELTETRAKKFAKEFARYVNSDISYKR